MIPQTSRRNWLLKDDAHAGGSSPEQHCGDIDRVVKEIGRRLQISILDRLCEPSERAPLRKRTSEDFSLGNPGTNTPPLMAMTRFSAR
mmetsp:Transcript_119942/g.344716  ORF Transcript_119942/g.344716 Transcript_119942/m.344716 type:complete len:88 (-) Transcript_119942:328-591(-)